jgi:Carboxypeptidase regulatory-like domain/TonB dependent receptor/TonB-dependent Receptor Plug Domain
MRRSSTALPFPGLVLLVVCLSSLPAIAQGVYGTITGTVTDSSGGVVPGASVTLTNIATNVSKTLTTNEAGVYSVTSLIPGSYRVEAAIAGFKTAVVDPVTLEVNATRKVDLTLEVGQTAEQVNVRSQAPLLQAEQTSMGQTVTEQQIEQLPTGRNLFSLIQLSAGVSQQAGCEGCGNNGNLRINGDRPRNQDYVLDGTTITAPVFGGQAINPAIDSIQEFRIEANSMSAEYGKAGGGVLVAVTKSGTNQFRGSGYEYMRNERLNARNFFEDRSQPKNPFSQNEFGGTIGGPVLKNKLFFFTDYQGLRSDGSSPVTGVIVPDDAFRSGDLSGVCTAGFDAAGICSDATQQIRFPGSTVPVPFNRIPGSQISPVSQSFLAVWPTSAAPGPNAGTRELSFTQPFDNSLNRVNARVDYQASASDQVFGVLHWQWARNISYPGNLIVGPAGEQIGRADDYSFTAGWTRTMTSTLLNSLRFGYMHRIGHRTNLGQGFTSPGDFGLQGIPDCLSSVPDTAGGQKCGTPGVNVTGYQSFSTGGILYEPADTLQISDSITTLIGRHSLKAGGEARHYAIDNYQPNGVAGSFTFSGSQTGHAFADFLFGRLNTGSVEVQNAMVSTRAWSYALYVQDDFKVTPTLTLNLGLRWQYDQSFRELNHGLAFFNPFDAEWEQFGVNAPETTFDPSWKQFSPRVGIAWNAARTIVVRGGYGITYPSAVGHGRAGDGQPGPNLLARTPIAAGASWSNLPPITNPDPQAITAPIPVNSNVSFSSWAPREQTPPRYHLWNVAVEKQLGASTMVQAAYVGSHGSHLPINYAYNICQQTPESTAEFGYGATTSPYCPLAAERVLAAGGSLYDLVITPGYWGLSSSDYHSFQAKFERRFSDGFSVLANFTWSKLMDDSSSDWGGFWSLDVLGQDFYNRQAERSVSAGDIPLRLTVAPIVELPFGPGHRWLTEGVASHILGGWRAAAIYTASSGSPFGITDNSYGYCNAAHTLTNRPMLTGDPRPSGFNQTLDRWFDTTAFDFSGTCPAPGLLAPTGGGDPTKAFGNAPRYYASLRNPGVNNIDFSLQKDVRYGGGDERRLRFRADFFNLLNHPQFGEPVADPTNASFGRVTRTSLNNRTVQLGLHVYF